MKVIPISLLRSLVTFFLVSPLVAAFSQSTLPASVEAEILKNANPADPGFQKIPVDLNADGKEDILYFFQCGEPVCIKALLNVDGGYKEVVNEQCSSYEVSDSSGKKMLALELSQCCGESPYLSHRTFKFNEDAAALKENYVLTNGEYLEQTGLLIPLIYSPYTYAAEIILDNYNLRFSPALDNLTAKEKESFTYGCEPGTNIIAKLKRGSEVMVMAEFIEKDRRWLFVEVKKDALAGACDPLDFEFEDQKLRGWISDKFVKRKL